MPLPATLVFDYPTPAAIAGFLASQAALPPTTSARVATRGQEPGLEIQGLDLTPSQHLPSHLLTHQELSDMLALDAAGHADVDVGAHHAIPRSLAIAAASPSSQQFAIVGAQWLLPQALHAASQPDSMWSALDAVSRIPLSR
jgi:hypothetical protein